MLQSYVLRKAPSAALGTVNAISLNGWAGVSSVHLLKGHQREQVGTDLNILTLPHQHGGGGGNPLPGKVLQCKSLTLIGIGQLSDINLNPNSIKRHHRGRTGRPLDTPPAPPSPASTYEVRAPSLSQQ